VRVSVEHFDFAQVPAAVQALFALPSRAHFSESHAPPAQAEKVHFSAPHFSVEHLSAVHFSVEHFSRETCFFSQHSSLSSHLPSAQAVFSALHFSLSLHAAGQSPPLHFAS
jgi:hypothetical protein